MGHLEKRIIIGALGLVAVLLTVVIFKGLSGEELLSLEPAREKISIHAEGPWPRKTTQQDNTEPAPAKEKEFVAPPKQEEALMVDEPMIDVVDETVVLSTKTLYTIKRGDILGVIAQKELGSVRYVGKIKELNPGIIDSNLAIGDVLVLPAKHTLVGKVEAQEALSTSSENTHVVVTGDSLSLISGKYYPGKYEYIEKIVGANKKLFVNGKNTVLHVGWKLILPE